MTVSSQSTVSIVRRPIKHVRLRVREDSSVEMIVPDDFPAADIDSVLGKKAHWIKRQQQFFEDRNGVAPPVGDDRIVLFGDVFECRDADEADTPNRVDLAGHLVYTPKGGPARTRWYRFFAREYLVRRTKELAEKHGFCFGRVFVRAQRTKWGNCSRRLNISLNWHLIKAPFQVIDYVVLHELLHTQIRDHSHRFWVHLKAICPGYEDAVKWLQENKPRAAVE